MPHPQPIKHIFILAVILAAGYILSSCKTGPGSPDVTAGPELVFRLASELKPDSRIWEASRLFKDEIEKASPDGKIREGEISVVFYDQGMIGTERQLLENCFFGVVEMVQVNSSVVTTIDPAFSILDLPYLFVDEEHHEEVLYGEIGQQFLDRLGMMRLKGIGFYGTGFRNLFYKVNEGDSCAQTPEDLNGLKIRVMESPIMINSINSIGARATPIPFSELFQALKTGVVDGAENSARIFISYKYHETGCNCFTLTEHFANQHIIIANSKWFESLEPGYQSRIIEVARMTAPMFDSIWTETTSVSLREMQDRGVTVNRIGNKTPFIERGAGVIRDYRAGNPDLPLELLDRIQEIGKKYMQSDPV